MPKEAKSKESKVKKTKTAKNNKNFFYRRKKFRKAVRISDGS